MSVLEKLYPASFRGVDFLVSTETKEGGKKTVTHEYPNSDKRFTEEMGKFPPKIILQAVIHGDDAINNRLALEAALDKEGIGVLVHPVYGSIDIKSTTYSATGNQRAIGEFRFTINFEVSDANVTPAPAPTTPSAVSSASADSRLALDNALGDNYKVPTTGENQAAAVSKASGAWDSISNTILSATGTITDKAATLNRTASGLVSQAGIIVQDSEDIQTAFTSLYNSALAVAAIPSTLSDAWQDLLDYGTDLFSDTEDENSINPTTVSRTDRETNRSIMNEHTRISALVNLYESAAYTDFDTDEGLDAARATLDSSFDSLMNQKNNVQEDIPSLADNEDVVSALNDLRSKSNRVFDQKDQVVFRVVDIDPKRSSMVLTSYQYYGSLDNVDIITALNPSINASNFKGEIKAVSGNG